MEGFPAHMPGRWIKFPKTVTNMTEDRLFIPALTFWMIVGQGPIALAVGAGGGCLDIFTLLYPFSPLSPSLSETAR